MSRYTATVELYGEVDENATIGYDEPFNSWFLHAFEYDDNDRPSYRILIDGAYDKYTFEQLMEYLKSEEIKIKFDRDTKKDIQKELELIRLGLR